MIIIVTFLLKVLIIYILQRPIILVEKDYEPSWIISTLFKKNELEVISFSNPLMALEDGKRSRLLMQITQSSNQIVKHLEDKT